MGFDGRATPLARAPCLPCSPLLRVGSGCTHLLQASFGLPVLLPGAGVEPVPSRLSFPEHPVGSHLCPAAPPRAEPFSRRSQK